MNEATKLITDAGDADLEAAEPPRAVGGGGSKRRGAIAAFLVLSIGAVGAVAGGGAPALSKVVVALGTVIDIPDASGTYCLGNCGGKVTPGAPSGKTCEENAVSAGWKYARADDGIITKKGCDWVGSKPAQLAARCKMSGVVGKDGSNNYVFMSAKEACNCVKCP